MGDTIEERCGSFYTTDEIEQMKREITEAKCSICMYEIKTEPLAECSMCENLHSFHTKCLDSWWSEKPYHCPSCNEERYNWKTCKTTKDLHSGGKQKYSKLKKSIRNRRNRK